MFADQVAEAHKQPEEPSMLRRALRALMPDISKENMDAMKKQQNNPDIVDIGADPEDAPYDLKAPLPDGIDRRNMDELIKQQRELTGYKTPVYGDPTGQGKGKRDIRAEAEKQYAFLKNRDFDLVEAPDEKSFPDGKESDRDAADLFTPTPDNPNGRQQLRVYQPDKIREVDVAQALLQRDPELDKIMAKLSPKRIKAFGGEDKMRYFMARHAVGGYSPEEEQIMAQDTEGTPLKELAYLRNYARTGKTLSPVGEMKEARGQS